MECLALPSARGAHACDCLMSFNWPLNTYTPSFHTGGQSPPRFLFRPSLLSVSNSSTNRRHPPHQLIHLPHAPQIVTAPTHTPDPAPGPPTLVLGPLPDLYPLCPHTAALKALGEGGGGRPRPPLQTGRAGSPREQDLQSLSLSKTFSVPKGKICLYIVIM